MENEFFERLLNILSEISSKIDPIPFWEDFTFWVTVATTSLLFLTWCFLFRYTRATEKIAEHQLAPAVDVNMVYDRDIKKTYFWFSNASSIPAFVLIKYDINRMKKGEVGPLRIAPYHPRFSEFKKTATFLDIVDEDSYSETNIVLDITITPALKKSPIKVEFTKSYKFDQAELQWNEKTWSYPDPPFPNR
jgi:hypothetical protein